MELHADTVAPNLVASYYDKKTKEILAKYGPGPGVNFHIGFFEDANIKPGATGTVKLKDLSEVLHSSQRNTLRKIASLWDAESIVRGKNVLDVGCGLGGGSLFWYNECGAKKVTGITISEEHVTVAPLLMKSHSLEAAQDITFLKHDACDPYDDLPDTMYDVAVALESSCYFDRDKWFEHLSKKIAPGGYVLIEDVFMNFLSPDGERGKKCVDDRWHTKVGTLEEYLNAACKWGFALESIHDLTAHTASFWLYSIEWEKQRQAEKKDSSAIEVHSLCYQYWMSKGIQVLAIRFRKPYSCS